MMKRRQALQVALVNGFALVAAPSPHAQTLPDIAALLKEGGCAVMLRHAQTEPGVGDPPNFQLDQCSTQRNLSDEGRAQAVAIGRWFARHSLKPSSVQSSAWCRCQDTATLAFGQFNALAALSSTFNARSRTDAQTIVLKARLAAIARGTFEVWVTHQVNVTALTGEVPSMGEALVIRTPPPDGVVHVMARTRFG
jgi:phosphohistidine phosphatase SixA